MPRMLFDRYKPAVDKKILPLTAGIVWVAVGLMLTQRAIVWLQAYQGAHLYLFVLSAIVLFIVKYRLVFAKIVHKNLRRIQGIQGKPCFFSFVSWKSYLLVAVMVVFGLILRNSSIPREYLSVIYLGIGMAMVISGTRYFGLAPPRVC